MRALNAVEVDITNYLTYLSARQKQAVLSDVKTFAADQKDWWDEIGVEQQQAIDKALAEVKAGRVTRHTEVMKKYKKL